MSDIATWIAYVGGAFVALVIVWGFVNFVLDQLAIGMSALQDSAGDSGVSNRSDSDGQHTEGMETFFEWLRQSSRSH